MSLLTENATVDSSSRIAGRGGLVDRYFYLVMSLFIAFITTTALARQSRQD
jgi:hypothetical protein